MSITITWHGHSTYSIVTNGTRLLVDPFLKPNNPVAVKSADEVSADYVLVTHGHGDHIADALAVAQANNAQIIANFEIVNWFGSAGYDNAHPQHIGGGFKHPFGHVKMTPALHGSGLPDGSYGGNPGGFLLTLNGKRIYIAGDTAVFSDMQLIARDGIDVAILPIGDNFTMGPDDALLAVSFLKPKVVIPCHYNTWPLIAVDAAGWANRVAAETESRAKVLEVEGSFTL